MVWSPAKLRELNPELAPLIMEDPKYTRVTAKLGAVVFKSQDARYFQIEPATGKIQPLDDAALASQHESKKADTAFNSLEPEGKSLRRATSHSRLIWNRLLDEGSWYALLTSDERANLGSNPPPVEGYSAYETLAEAPTQLFRAPYEKEYRQALNEHVLKLDLAGVSQVTPERFLLAGFLRRPDTGSAWRISPQPRADAALASGPSAANSYLVLHKKALGEKSPWHVTRLGMDGAIHWTRSTGLVELDLLCAGDGSVVFTGIADDPRPQGNRPDLMVFIDETTGESRTLNVASNEMTAVG